MFVTALSTLERIAFTTESSYTKHSGKSSYGSSTIEQVPTWRSSNTPNDPPISSFQLVPQPRLAPQQQLVFLPQLVHRQLVQQQLVQRQLVQRQLVQRQLVQQQLVRRQLVQRQLVQRQLAQQLLVRRQLVQRQLVQWQLVQ